MKPVFVLLVSTAWTLTGAQYYYQGLMDYLENRLLAIEVSDLRIYINNNRKKPIVCISLVAAKCL